jgi:site-specific recombinase XerD
MRHISGVSVCGPLARYVEGFWEELAEQGYTPLSAANQLRLMAHLSRWLEAEGLDAGALSTEVMEQFLVVRRSAGYTCWLSERGMGPLLVHLRRLGVSPAPVSVVTADPVQVLVSEFVAYLRAERGLAPSTIGHYEMVARRFLSTRTTEGRLDLAGLKTRDVTAFVTSECTGRSVGVAKNLVSDLRALLRFLHLTGRTEFSLAPAVPAVAGWRGSALPRALGRDEVTALLKSCDRRRRIGRRDYAVLTLLVRLGLRAGEVARLRLEDLDWDQGEILVRGKGGRLERLPLPVDVGEAVVAYLRRGRGDSRCRELFLRARAPEGALSPGAVTAIVHQACLRAGVSPVGAHALRHSAATEMLRNGVPIAEIAQVLRHASTSTTAIYAKVDRNALRLLTEPWPGEAS